MDTEDIPHIHPDYPIDITGWTFPKRRFSMAKYCSRRTVNQYTLPSDTNVQFFTLSSNLMFLGHIDGYQLSQTSGDGLDFHAGTISYGGPDSKV
jgi:hypothetical protein